MRHKKSGKKLGRTSSQRKALLSNLTIALFENKKIKTTIQKAKELRGFSERMITFGKKGDLASRRHVLKYIPQKEVVKELFENIAPKYKNRNGGYTRITKLGNRKGDNASLAFVELVGFESYFKKKSQEKAEKKEKKKEKKESKKTKESKKESQETAENPSEKNEK